MHVLLKPRTHIPNKYPSANLVCLPNGFVKNCLASTYGKCEQISQWCQTNILWCLLNYQHLRECYRMRTKAFAYAEPSPYIHFRGTNAVVRYMCKQCCQMKIPKISHFQKKTPHKSAHFQYGYQMQGIFKQNAKMEFIFTICDSLFHFYS